MKKPGKSRLRCARFPLHPVVIGLTVLIKRRFPGGHRQRVYHSAVFGAVRLLAREPFNAMALLGGRSR